MDYDEVWRHWDDPSVLVHGDVGEEAIRSFAKEVLGVLRPRGGDRVLDVGCGDGLLAAQIRPYVGSIFGFDFAQHRVCAATSAVPDGEFWQQSFLDPIPGQYDVAYSFSVLQYAKPADIDLVIGNCLEAAAVVAHCDVPDRRRLHRLPAGPKAKMLAVVCPRTPIWKDGSYAHDLRKIAKRWRERGTAVRLADASCPYRRHLVIRR